MNPIKVVERFRDQTVSMESIISPKKSESFIDKRQSKHMIRRAAMISLFDLDSDAMLNCKAGNWWENNPQRGRRIVRSYIEIYN